jgi:hypothetical protein
MKLLIEQDFVTEIWPDMKAVVIFLKRCTIYHQSISDSEVKILQQKIVLDEVDINTFFMHIDRQSYRLEYASLGGVGCDMALNVYPSELK